jgi:hypothetical protein
MSEPVFFFDEYEGDLIKGGLNRAVRVAFGVCPTCGRSDGFRSPKNRFRPPEVTQTFFTCEKHHVYWTTHQSIAHRVLASVIEEQQSIEELLNCHEISPFYTIERLLLRKGKEHPL